MKLSDFILLNVEEKKIIVLHEGVLVAKRNSLNRLVFLFQLDDFYVESHCHLENKTIEEYVIFKDINTLHPSYLASISLDGLLN